MKNFAIILEKIISDFNIFVSKKTIDWEYKLEPVHWSRKEILGHLIDSASINIHRFMRGIYEENFKIVYQQNDWVKHQHYQIMPLSDILSCWILLNKKIIVILKNYPENRKAVTIDIGHHEPEVKNIQEVAEGYVDHLLHHLRQIEN